MLQEMAVIKGHHPQWAAQLAGLAGVLWAANVPYESYALLMRIFEPMAQRINHLHGQAVAKRS